MSGLTAEAVLAIWEQVPFDDPVRGPLRILALADPAAGEEELLGLSIGERDERLLALRQQLFGDQLNGFTHCPHCGERLEFSLSSADLHATEATGLEREHFTVETPDAKARVRAPTSYDLLAAQACATPAEAASMLLERCIVSVEQQGQGLAPHDLHTAERVAIAEQLSQHQAAADVELSIACSACEHRWVAQFDIASYFSDELRRYATQLLDQVHILAAAYGWQEHAILAMHPQRRHAYLQRVLG